MKLTVVFDTLAYNDVATATPRVMFEFEWELDKNGTMKSLSQDIRINGMRRISTEYSGNTNQTKIVDKVKEEGEKSITKSTKTGLQTLTISTLKGVLGITY